MKKFLTVLLVIAVMFTFSFGSAFATVTYEGAAASKKLAVADDYLVASGTVGITEAYRASLIDTVDGYLDSTGPYAEGNFYAPELAKATTLVEKAMADLKAAKTAAAADTIVTTLNGKLDDLKKEAASISAELAAVKASTVAINYNRLITRYGAQDAPNADKSAYDYYLPGYGVLAKNDVTTTATTVGALATAKTFVADWFMDNDYRVDVTAGASAFLAALVPVTTTYTDAIKAEQNALQDEVYKYVDKAAITSLHGVGGLTTADLEGLDALLKKVADFKAKYETLGAGAYVVNTTELVAKVDSSSDLAKTYFDQYCSEVSTIPTDLKKLTDADKAKVIDLHNKVSALLKTYKNVWKLGSISALTNTLTHGYTNLEAAYNYFKTADADAIDTVLGEFTATTPEVAPGATPSGTYDFDASEKNVAAIEKARTLFDEYVKNYDEYLDAAKEAKILAAENNKATIVGYEKLDNSKVQAYLNNATVKVTTKALGNKKVRVQATIDATSFDYILKEMSDGCTVSYQFYYKKAANTEYKAGKVKDVNYTTFKLTKGVKYNFQCKVVIKDADGNVVATKDYKASTVGTRTVK